ncbi:class I SAM-dependent methyltransferase [Methylocystis sp. SC2]|uniref:class I SAM-dependent methyltransferase n=1 Tax=Methylocystis sp. (strain SC2) TaxID=187303 RepID=UPI00027AED51|nr:class I SAM-dependent methyltransferase [Methylocystis sp. SC2]CCJ06344.1 Putative methyltransferase [Methylocystis sp. SC2]
MSPFSVPETVARYAEGPVRKVPGFHALQRMTGVLLAERVPEDGNLLVLGAGGGLELKAFAETHPGWRFCGVDPSAEMLGLAERTLGPFAERVDLHLGYIDSAPAGPFDAATCLLTMHFIPEEERRRTMAEIHRRLRSGSPFVVAHHSFPQQDGEKAKWLARYAAFAAASGDPDSNAENAIAAIGERLPILSPEQDEAILLDAGFTDVTLFYAGFTFRGWVGYKP